jgi:hypothetical protein
LETAVGAALYNRIVGSDVELSYWSSRNRELDFVLRRGGRLVAIEVKCGPSGRPQPGMAAFCADHEVERKLLVGGEGIPLAEFLRTDPSAWFE